MNLKIKSKLFSFLKLAGFIAACAAASFLVIAPLWLFAVKQPKLYTAAVLAVASILVLYKIIVAAKKAGAKKSLFLAAKIIAAAAGFAGAVVSLMNWRRALCLACLVAAIALFQAIRLFEKKVQNAQR